MERQVIRDLAEYLDRIVEPTFADFRGNPRSARHAFLACVATFHAVDRAAAPHKPAGLRQEWRKKSLAFAIIDNVAHHFKHIRVDSELHIPPNHIPLSAAVFDHGSEIPEAMDLDLHNLHFAVRDAIKFVREQALTGIGVAPTAFLSP